MNPVKETDLALREEPLGNLPGINIITYTLDINTDVASAGYGVKCDCAGMRQVRWRASQLGLAASTGLP